MADPRTLLAAVLGVALGVLCLVYPEALIRAQTVGRLPHDAGGEYGRSEGGPGGSSARIRWLVRLLGVVALAGGGYFALAALS
jgi:hypothetical protein